MTSTAPERPLPERLYAVEIDLDRSARELVALRDRVALLRLETTGASPTWPAPPSPAPPIQGVPSPEPPRMQPESPPWWRREGAVARVLSVVGAGVLLLGVTFLLVLAVQYGYFGPVPRVVAGAVGSVALVLLGAVVHRRQADNPGAVALAATGIAGGLLVVVAVTTLYGWVALPAGLALAGIVGGVGVALARRWDSEVLSVIIVVGLSVLAPVVAEPAFWAADLFLIVLAAAALLLLRRPDWAVLHVARVVGPAAILFGSALSTDRVDHPVAAWTVAGTTATFALLTVVGELRTYRAEPGPARSSILAAVAIVPALVAPLLTTDGWMTTLWLALLAGCWLALATRSRHTLPVTVLVAAGAVSLLLALGSLEIDGALVPSVLVVGLVFVVAGVLRGDRVVGRVGAVVGALGLLGHLPSIAPLLGLSELTAWHLVASVATLALAGAGWRFLRTALPGRAARYSYLVLLPTALLGVLGVCVGTGSLLGRLAGDPATGFLAGHAVATLGWLVAAGAWLLSTSHRPDAVRLRAAVAVTGLAVAKLLLFDLATLDGLIRVAAFVVVGAVLLAVGTRYARTVKAPA